ncbi:hypothetical protein ABBQ32_004196 [Trebouxia sp. C0010 RCD-2024]
MNAEDHRIEAKKKCFWLPDHLTGSDTYSETWPRPLRLFAYYLSRPASSFRPTVPETVSNLRKYYPEDQVLMQFARFLESAIKDDPDVTFTHEYKHALIPRCPDGSRSFSATQQSSELKNE